MSEESRKTPGGLLWRATALLTAAVLAAGALPVYALEPQETQQVQQSPAVYGEAGVDYVPGEAIVCVNGKASLLTGRRSRGLAFETETLMEIPEAAEDGAAAFALTEPEIEQTLVLVKADADVETIIETLEADPNVEYAEPNYIMVSYEVDDSAPARSTGESANPGQSTPETATPESAAVEPMTPAPDDLNKALGVDDPAVPYQYGLEQMDVAGAWDTLRADGKLSTDPTDPVVVAVLDTGVDYYHEDLKNVMWDDGEKYDALTALDGGQYGLNVADGDTTEPMDTGNGHGTHCAGIIAAQANNALGGVGVASGAGVQIMALRALDDNGSGAMSDSLYCFEYVRQAKLAGVNVVAISNSWGAYYYERQNRSVSTAVTALGQMGVVSIFSANNDGVDNDRNTGSITDSPYAITVGADNSAKLAAAFSQYGQSTVDVFAPGVHILSATTTHAGENAVLAPQYLPRLQAPEDSYFFEGFEDDEDTVQVLLHKSRTGKVGEAQKIDEGYLSGHSMALNLDGADDRTFVTLKFTLPEDLGDEDDPLYLHLKGKFENILSARNDSLYITLPDEEGMLIPLDGVDENWLYMWNSDQNWTTLSAQLDAESSARLRAKAGQEITLYLWADEGWDLEEDPVIYLDELGIGRAPTNGYYYSDGTSMACPMAAGVAALAALAVDEDPRSADFAAEVCARVKGSAQYQSDLEGLCVTEGIVNAAAAVGGESGLSPVLDDLTVENGQATLTGYWFGSGQGTLECRDLSDANNEWVPVKTTGWADGALTFAAPSAGRYELRVTRTDGKTGRNFFTVGSTAVGYADLNAPALEYESFRGTPLTSADTVSLAMAGANGQILRLAYMDETKAFVLEHGTKQPDGSFVWDKAPFPEEFYGEVNSSFYSMAGAGDKIYLLGPASDEDAEGCRLYTYDTLTGSWSSVLVSQASRCSKLAVYDGKLLVLGGMQADENGDNQLLRQVRTLDPTTGKLSAGLPDFPTGDIDEDEVDGLSVQVCGDWLALCSAPDTLGNYNFTPRVIAAWDGREWHTYDDAETQWGDQLDAGQTLRAAFGADGNALLAAGPVSDLAGADMCDTWQFDFTSGKWSPRTDALLSRTKTALDMGVMLDDTFYVMAMTADDQNGLGLLLRSLPVEYKEPGEVWHSEPEPEPSPSTPDTPSPSASAPATSSPSPSAPATPSPTAHKSSGSSGSDGGDEDYIVCEACGHHDWTQQADGSYRCDNCGQLRGAAATRAAGATVPATGDASTPILWAALILLCAGGWIGLKRAKKQKG